MKTLAHLGSVIEVCQQHNMLDILHHLNTNALVRNSHAYGHSIYRNSYEFFTTRPVFLNTRIKVTAGKAALFKQIIILHQGLLDPNDHLYKDLPNTFFHELSHLIAFKMAKDKGHGDAWKYCIQHFGFDPARCYNPFEFNYRNYGDRKERKELAHVYDAVAGIEQEL